MDFLFPVKVTIQVIGTLDQNRTFLLQNGASFLQTSAGHLIGES